MKNILNIAWINQGDFGDEVMAFVLRRFLKQNNAGDLTYYKIGRYPNLIMKDDMKFRHLYHYDSNNIIVKILDHFYLKKFGYVIFGGGSILHSLNSVVWKLELLKIMKKYNPAVKSALLGVSINPIEFDAKQKKIKEFLDLVDIGLFRDSYSGDLARKLSGNKNLYDSFDSSLLLPFVLPEEFKKLSETEPDESVVGLILALNHSISKERKEIYRNKYLKIINYILSRGKKVALINLYGGSDYDDDELNDYLRRHCLDPQQVNTYSFSGDIFATAGAIKSCGCLLSMRYHGIVFAYMLGVPFISLGYDPKNSNFCLDINYPKELTLEAFSYDFETEPVFTGIDYLLKQRSHIFSSVLDPKKASERVANNFNKLFKEVLS